MYVYLPSCNFTAADPQASKKIKEYLSTQPDLRVTGCCRPAQKTLTAADTVLTICLSCAAITHEVSPQAREESLYEYLLQNNSFPWPDYGGEEMLVQDCWRARHKPALQQAVRDCLRKMNIVPVELPVNRQNTQYDGVWRFNPVLQRNLDIAPDYFGEVQRSGLELLPKEEQLTRMKENARQYGSRRVVTYCNACLKGVQLGGAQGVHILGLLTRDL